MIAAWNRRRRIEVMNRQRRLSAEICPSVCVGGVLNLAHGAFYALGAYASVELAKHLGFGPAVRVADAIRRSGASVVRGFS